MTNATDTLAAAINRLEADEARAYRQTMAHFLRAYATYFRGEAGRVYDIDLRAELLRAAEHDETEAARYSELGTAE